MEHAIPVERKAIKPKNATVRRTLVVMTLPETKTKVAATEDVEVSEAEVVAARSRPWARRRKRSR